MKQLLILVLFFISSSSDASLFHHDVTSEAQCTPVDFRDSFPLKMRNQKKIDWCFAYATADYLQYLEQTPIQISAADIAINYSKSSWSRFLHFFKRILSAKARGRPAETGIAKYAAQMILPQGYCPEEALPSDDWTRVSQNGKRESLEILEAAKDIFQLQKQIRSGAIQSPESLPYFYEFKHIDANSFFSILKRTNKRTVLEGIRTSACTKAERVPFQRKIEVTMGLRTHRIFKSINSSLNEKLPVTFDFFSGVLKNIDAPTDITRHFHTVLLYGRTWDSERNVCRFLIKNSYGSDCSSYDPRLNCDLGYLWIPEDVLYRTMTSFDHDRVIGFN